jgi:FAS-associated factor 2
MFVDEVRDKYGLTIPFFEGSLEDAQRTAVETAKYLVLYLHSPQHENTEQYLREVLGADEIIALLSENCILCGVSVTERRGHQLAKELGAHAFPFVAALFRRKVILRLQGYHTRETFRQEWRLCTEDWDAFLAQEISLVAEREARERARVAEEVAATEMEAADRAILEELQRKEEAERTAAAAQAAAEAERAKAEERGREERERQAAEEAQQRALAAQRLKQKEAAKEQASGLLHDEPAASVPADQTVQISVRCPSGKQHSRRFLRSDLVDQLSLFVLTLDELADATDVSAVHFVTGFPPAPLEWEKGVTKFSDVESLCPRAVVLLRRS